MAVELTANQTAAVKSNGRPLFIQAGAGTGKTFTLTKRIGYGLSPESGPLVKGIENLLVITFTEKAAGELMGRIRRELRVRGLKDAALHIDGALVSTIHSMCSTMLSEHALEAGIDPGAALLSEEESNALMDLALEQVLDQMLSSSEYQTLAKALKPSDAFKLIRQLAELYAGAPDGPDSFDCGPAPAGSPVNLLRSLQAQIEALHSVLADLGIEDGGTNAQKALASLIAYEEGLSEFLSEGGDCSWTDADVLLGGLKVPKGGNSGKQFKDTFIEITGLIVEAEMRVATAAAWDQLKAAGQIAWQVCLLHGRLKTKRGFRDTNDLLVGAYKLLRDNPSIAKEYEERFATVMIDEFQDTDPLQVGIVEHICDENLTTLTTVGDAQQSIYGFRNADLETYRAMRKRMQGCGSHEVKLDVNYRSHPEVLTFVEEIFSKREFFGEEFLRISAGPSNGASHAWIGDGDPHVRLVLSAGNKDGRKSTGINDLILAEADSIAQQFYEFGQKGASYGDMAILMSSTKKAQPYLDAMRRRGIPCAISGGSDYFKQPEVRVLTNLLRFIEMPEDDEALLQVLCSPLFDLSDDDLLAVRIVSKRDVKRWPDDPRAKCGLWQGLCAHAANVIQDPDDPLIRTFEVLNWALSNAAGMSLSSIIGKVVVSSGWKSMLQSAGAEGVAIWANIVHFQDMVEEFEKTDGRDSVTSAEHFRSMCEMAQEGTGGRGKLGSLIGDGSGTVKIMTIHSSKGLEFPIVAVAQFDREAGTKAGKAVSLTEDGTRAMTLSVSKSKLGDVVEDRVDSFAEASDASSFAIHAHLTDVERQKEENQRLLYVALTRAKDVLILCLCAKTFMANGSLGNGLSAQVVEAILPDEVQLPANDTALRLANNQMVDYFINDVPVGDDEEIPEQQIRFATHLLAPISLESKIVNRAGWSRAIASYSSISALAKARGERQATDFVDAWSIFLQKEEPEKETVSEVGSAFHGVAEWIALNGDFDSLSVEDIRLAARIDAACVRYGLDEAGRARLSSAVKGWIGSDRFKQVSQYDRIRAEHPFCVSVAGQPLEGFIDLLCLNDDGKALVIDYKTGTSGDESELEERYRIQAWCYAYALLSSNTCDSVEMVFVHPERSMLEVKFAFDVGDIDDLSRRIVEA